MKLKCGLRTFVGLSMIVLILIALIAGLIITDMKILSLKLQNQVLMPQKQFLNNKQSSEMDRLEFQNQNLIKDLSKLEDTISFLKDSINYTL